MVEEEAAFVKVQARKAGNFMITIPADVAETLKIKESQKAKVLFDKENKRVIYEFYEKQKDR